MNEISIPTAALRLRYYAPRLVNIIIIIMEELKIRELCALDATLRNQLNEETIHVENTFVGNFVPFHSII